jgi:hypothetical protein
MKYIFTFIFVTVCVGSLSAQITISSPLNRAVYQRNLSNQATLEISGNYNFNIVTSIQARLVNPSNNSPIGGFDWTIIEINPSKGFFQGKLVNAPAGWFRLEVRANKGSSVLGSTSVDKVGIGDVYAIAGQSNAQGYHNGNWPYTMEGINATDERVVSHDNGMYCANYAIPFPEFTQIQATTKIGTNGKASWLWGRLGDYLIAETGVPVAFFNYGAAGSSSQNWVESSQGLATVHPFTGQQFCSLGEENDGRPWSIGQPYGNFKRGLNFYNSMFGARAVLWHQGESDNLLSISQSGYQNNLNHIINKSRADFSSELPWMVARASYYSNTAYGVVLQAQTDVIGSGYKVFGGPFTDDINNNNSETPNSRDGINLHFSNPVGLTLVADGWKGAITQTNFLATADPVLANTPPVVTVTINTSNQAVMTVPSGYASYKWIRTDQSGNHTYEGTASEGNTRTLTKNDGGTYRCWVVASNGNLQLSAPINTNAVLNLTQNGSSCVADAYVSDLKYSFATNGRGPVELDKTAGDAADGDGVAIVLKSTPYSKGLGVFGNSEVSYRLPDNAYHKFRATIGIGDNILPSCSDAAVVFKVIGDGVTLYTSPSLSRSSAAISLDVNIAGKKVITLKTEASNTSWCNQAVWAGAVFKCDLGDIEPPTAPSNLVATDTLTKCINFTWNASTDDYGVTGYDILKNSAVIATVSAATLSYRLTGLSSNETLTFEVRAKDAANNLSPLASTTITTKTFDVAYMGPSAFCVSTTYLPNTVVPAGGQFSLESGPAATVNASTGAFYSDVVALNFVVNYSIGAGIAGCEDATTIPIGTTPPPMAPTVTANNKIVNEGNPVTLSASCAAGSTLWWNVSPLTTSPINHVPAATQVYYAECRKNGSFCYVKSNEVTVTVIPNCHPTLNLVKPTNNLSGNAALVKYNASGTVQANNVISPTNRIEYNSAQSVTLNPGFTVEPGVVFKAEIKNCP